MSDSTLVQMPSARTVLTEQMRAAGLAVRREAAVAAAVLALPVLGLAIMSHMSHLQVVIDSQFPPGIVFDPSESWPAWTAILSALFVWLLWRGEEPFGSTPLWSLPVEHRRHALAKVTAGWAWLMVTLGALYAWYAVMILASGGHLGAEGMRLLVNDVAGAASGTPGASRSVAWTTPWWQWLMPFTSGTVSYLLVSTLLLGTRHPVRGIVTTWAVFLTVGLLAERAPNAWLSHRFDVALWYLGMGEPFSRGITLPDGTHTTAWLSLPSAGLWVAGTVVWTLVGVAGVLAAIARPRDH